MTVNSRIVKTFLQWSPDAVDVPLMNGLRVQILPTMADVAKARKHQFAAFIASEQLLVVWDDEAMNLMPRAKAIENELMELVWKTGEEEDETDGPSEKKGPQVVEIEIDEETGQYKPEKRPTNVMNSVLVAFTLLLITITLGAGFRQVVIEIMVDKGYARLAFLSLTPIQIFFTLVSDILPPYQLNLTCSVVFCTGHCRLYCPMHRARPSDDGKLTILLCETASSDISR